LENYYDYSAVLPLGKLYSDYTNSENYYEYSAVLPLGKLYGILGK
jgi:hypothetical protein